MSKVDWTRLGTTKQGLAVEGQDDKRAIEAFLDAGEDHYWNDWRSQLMVEVTGSKVLPELDNERVWGLIDRDRRTADELKPLSERYPRLLILPRHMIENYCIAPDDLLTLLPPAQRERVPDISEKIEQHRDQWVQNGALWQTLAERGANQFCGGRETGYPMALLHTPVTERAAIERQLKDWHDQLEPVDILDAYESKLIDFRADQSANYTQHIHGKNFFHQIVVARVLNPSLGQRRANKWVSDLFSGVRACPRDIVPLLQRLVR